MRNIEPSPPPPAALLLLATTPLPALSSLWLSLLPRLPLPRLPLPQLVAENGPRTFFGELERSGLADAGRLRLLADMVVERDS